MTRCATAASCGIQGAKAALLAATILLASVASTLGAQGSTGTLFAQWGDPQSPTQAPRLSWVLVDDLGQSIEVSIAPTLIEQAGGYWAVNGRRVTVTGRQAGITRLGRRAQPVLEATSLQSSAAAAFGAPQGVAQVGSKAYAILLCKFSDISAEPGQAASYQTLYGNTYPNVDYYWREVSANQVNLSGSQVFGWFTLPHPKSFYVTGSSVDLIQLAKDCAASADPTVNFTPFFGIATHYNSSLDDGTSGSFSYGGSAAVTVDGVLRSVPFTWMAEWAAPGTTSRFGANAHEIGHSLGLPHSSGPYAQVYDSRWDVMSNAYDAYSQALGAWLPEHTIIFHKNLLGWIPPARRLIVANPSTQSFTLEASEFPPANTNPLMVQIPITGSADYYTVESRRLQGLDAVLPGEAVVIHRITSNYAYVVDPDNNGNPNDAGAMWLAGETFNDGHGVQLRIDSRTSTGWMLTVSVNAALPCTLTTQRNPTSGGTTTGTGTVPCGTAVTVSATPNTGYNFVSWTENNAVVSTSATFQLTVSTDRVLVANFAPKTYSIATSSLPLASGSTSGAGTYAHGTTASLKATPAPGFSFVRWTEGGTEVSPNASYQFTVTASRALVANFQPLPKATVATSSSPAAGGTTAGGGTVNTGSVVTVVATPAARFAFVNWTEGGVIVSMSASYQFAATANRTLVAHFVQTHIAVATSASPVAGGTVSGDGIFAIGAPVTLLAIPAAGYNFVNWTQAGVSVSTAATYTFDATVDRTLTANFVLRTYTVVTSSSPASGGTTTGDGTVSHGATVTVVATPAAYYLFSGWTENGTTISAAPSYQFTAAADRTLVAHFQAIDVQELVTRFSAGLLAGSPGLQPAEMTWVDKQGNQNSLVDLGDLVALLDKNPGVHLTSRALDAVFSSPTSRAVRVPLVRGRKP